MAFHTSQLSDALSHSWDRRPFLLLFTPVFMTTIFRDDPKPPTPETPPTPEKPGTEKPAM